MRKFALALAGVLLSAFAALGQQSIPAGSVIGNSTASARPARGETVTAILDRALGSTRGAIIERGASGWAIIGPGTAGLPFVSNGAGADPSYQVLPATGGGTGQSSYTIGDLLLANSTTTLAKLAGVATGNVLISGGVGTAFSWGKVTSSHLNITSTSCTNQYLNAISATGVGTCVTITLASASFANQGTTTTVLHGNAAGNPSFGAVVSADMNITTTSCTNQFVTAISSGGVGTCTTDTLASAQHANQGTTTQVLHGNAAGNPSWAAVSLTADITGTLAVGNGGTGLTAGTSGGVPYFNSTSTMASSALLAANQLMVGGGAGAAPSTIANGQIPGTATNDNASAGNVGQYTESIVNSGSAVSLTTGTAANITSISLTAGDWDVTGVAAFAAGVTTNVTTIACSFSTTSATLDTSLSRLASFNHGTGGIVYGSANFTMPCATSRFSLSGTTTVFLVALSAFTVSTQSAYGIIRARRVR